MSRNTRLLFAVLLFLTTVGRAVSFGTALSVAGQNRRGTNTAAVESKVPQPVSFREVRGRGLIVRTWINSVGPFDFAIDTGAGATLLSQRVADEARVVTKGGRTSVAGLSGIATSARGASIQRHAIGDS